MRIEEITTTKPPPTDEHIPAWPLRGTLVTGGKGKDVANGSGLIRATDPTGEVYAGRGSGERVQDGGMAGTREHQQTKLDQPRGGGSGSQTSGGVGCPWCPRGRGVQDTQIRPPPLGVGLKILWELSKALHHECTRRSEKGRFWAMRAWAGAPRVGLAMP